MEKIALPDSASNPKFHIQVLGKIIAYVIFFIFPLETYLAFVEDDISLLPKVYPDMEK